MKREKLSVLGIGPIYVGIILVITAILIFLQKRKYTPGTNLDKALIRYLENLLYKLLEKLIVLKLKQKTHMEILLLRNLLKLLWKSSLII